jgi:uncharacterized membrane protein
MTKQEFIDALRHKMAGLPKDDIEDRVAFYTEMIDDRVEDGLSEEQAVAEIGNKLKTLLLRKLLEKK